jgi:hypothetical protein
MHNPKTPKQIDTKTLKNVTGGAAAWNQWSQWAGKATTGAAAKWSW